MVRWRRVRKTASMAAYIIIIASRAGAEYRC